MGASLKGEPNEFDKGLPKASISFLSHLNAQIVYAAELLAQRAQDKPEAEPRYYHWMRVFIFALSVVVLTAIFGPPLFNRWNTVITAPIAVPFSKSHWKLIAPEMIGKLNESACYDTGSSSLCPAHPDNELAQNSPFSRADENHSEQVRKFGSKPFWLVYDLTSEELETALNKGANHLFIGLINGKYKIYINGVLLRANSPVPERGLVVGTIPVDEFKAKRVRIGVSVINDTQSAFPDIFESYFRSTGIVTTEALDGMMSLRLFVDETRHIVIACVYFMVSWFFFFLWRGTPKKRELFIFSILSLALGALSLRLAVSFYIEIPRYRWYQLELILRCAEALGGSFAGFAVARLRRDIFWMFGTVLGSTLIYFNLSSKVGVDYLMWSTFVAKVYVPFCYVLGAITCVLQWRWVHTQIEARKAHWLRPRASRLGGFSLIFIFLAAVYEWQAQHFGDPSSLVSLHRYTPMLAFLVATYILIREFRDQSQQLDYVPLSKYHRMVAPPEKIEGYLLEVDLKKSEPLYHAASKLSDHNALVGPFIDSWLAITRSKGGEVIEFAGDMIRVFFEVQPGNIRQSDAVLVTICKGIKEMATLMEAVARDIEERTGVSVNGLVKRAAFRSVISYGSIKPQTLGIRDQKLATWLNGDDRQVFLRVSRLLSAEKELMKYPDAIKETETNGPISTTLIDEEVMPTSSYIKAIEFFESVGFKPLNGLKVYLDEKKCYPPVHSLICWEGSFKLSSDLKKSA